MIVLITPTADRPAAVSLCEKWMARQTVKWDRWIVADSGIEKCWLTCGQEHLNLAPLNGFSSLCQNLLAAVDAVGRLTEEDSVFIIEDDDYYYPTHIEALLPHLQKGARIAGPQWLHYYNLAQRAWRKMRNEASAPLCGTALRGDCLGLLADAAACCQIKKTHNVDGQLWRFVPAAKRWLSQNPQLVGIKGLPGRKGLGIGHYPKGPSWCPDPLLKQLRAWVGDDIAAYEAFNA